MATQRLEQYNFNAETGEEKVIQLSAEESAYYLNKEKAFLESLAKAESEKVARVNRKAELLAKLGITEDDAKLLLS